FRRIMRMLMQASPESPEGGSESENGGGFESELDDTDGGSMDSSADRRRRAGDRERARDTERRGVLPSAISAQDALPTAAGERGFKSRFPGASIPKNAGGVV